MTLTGDSSASEEPSPSPAPSESSLSTQQGDEETPPRRTAVSARWPHRPLLRTAFRTFSAMANVVVGKANDKSRPQTRYLVHKELLTAASPFFAAALNGTFAESLDQEVRLPEEKPDSFEWFLQWLYTGTLTTQPCTTELPSRHQQHPHGEAQPTTTHGPGLAPPPTSVLGPNPVPAPTSVLGHPTPSDLRFDGDLRNSHGSPKYFLLLDLYALSDRLLTTPLSNHIVSTVARLSETTNSVPTPSDTWMLYDTIRETAPLRALVLDLFAYKKTDRLLDTHRDDWHPRFLRDLVVKLKRPAPLLLARHTLVAWRPSSWSATRACEACREVLRPMVGADRCSACERAFCADCVRRHGGEGGGAGVGGWMGDMGGCKPWTGKGICERYHEHGAESETCVVGDV